MTFLAFSGLVNCLGCLLVAAIVLYSNLKRRLNQSYCVFNLTVALYSFGYFFWQLSDNAETALLWFKLLFTGVIFINLVYLDFVFTFTESRQRHQWLLRICLVLNAWFLYLNWSSGLYTELVPRRGLGYWPIPTKWFHWYLAFWNFQLLYGYGWLWWSGRTQTGRKRGEYKYLLSAFFVGFFGGATNWPMWYDIPLPPYPNILIIVYLGIVAYAIIAKRLFDITLVARNVVVRGCALALVAAPLLVGRLLAASVRTFSWSGLTFGNIGALAGGVLNFSFAITLLRYDQHPQARLLCRFFLLLGLWESHELLLILPQTAFSVVLHRASYAIGCWVILSWAEFWKSYGGGNGLAAPSMPWFPWLRWTAYGMMGLCLFTPFVQQSLQFDPTMQRSAREVAGSAYPLFALWLLTAIAVSGVWTIGACRRANKAFSKGSLWWVMGSFSFAGAAAVNYVGYVQGRWPLPLYPLLAMLMSCCLVGTLWHQLNRNAWNVSPQDFSLGVTSLTVPFLAGFLFSGSAWVQAAAGMLLVIFVPRILREIHESVQAWVDRSLFTEFAYLPDFKTMAKGILPQVENLREFLPLLARQIVEKGQVQSCRVVIVESLTGRPRFQAMYTAAANGEHMISSDPWPDQVIPPLLKRLAHGPEILLHDELVTEGGGAPLVPGEELEAIVPLRQEGHTFGMIVVGPKVRRGRMMNQEDMNVLTGIAGSVSKALWVNLAHYEQILKTEQTLHDAINFQGTAQLRLRGSRGSPEVLTGLDTVMSLLRDLRFSNLVTLQRQRGEGLDMRPLDLGVLVTGLVKGLGPKAEAKGLKLLCNVANEVSPVLGYRQALLRVFENLINNAVKYTPQGDVRVTVGGAGALGMVRVEVADTGPGIAPEHLPHLFEPFYRVEGQSLEEGTGLGLSVVKELVETHGGRVWVESQPGVGSRFLVELPGHSGGATHG